MGILQTAYLTYDCHEHLVGQIDADKKEPLAPIGHILTRAQIEITVDSDGNFVEACAKDGEKILIPATEASAGRTSDTSPHPLCDQLCYLAPYQQKKYEAYVDQLEAWVNSPYTHPKLVPILKYVKGKSILEDLMRSDIIKLNENGIPTKEKDIVCWRVVGLGEENSGPCWTDKQLFDAFSKYSIEQKIQTEKALCMVTGEITTLANQHPKGIIAISGNAKLISSNDNQNFTYRGRFANDAQASTIGFIASQKIHNALRWLASNQGVIFGSRTFICWNPKGCNVPSVHSPITRSEPNKPVKPSEYREILDEVIKGYKAELPDNEDVVIAAFDAATTGRLAVTYYNNLNASDYLERLKHWDETCCWLSRYSGSEYGVQSPSLRKIIECAFGTQRSTFSLEVDKRVLQQQMQRLIACRVNKGMMPSDIVLALTQRASTPLAYEARKSNTRETILTTACAVIRKYRFDHKKEEWEMTLEPDRQDYSYQWGRLLAIMEKVERDTYQDNEGREPNAIRMQSVFCKRPLYASRLIMEQLKSGYYPKLRPNTRNWYEKLIEEIFFNLSTYPELEQDQQLKDTYLLGYYLQKRALYESKKRMEENEHE